VNVKLQTTGVPEARRRLDTMARNVLDARPALRKTAQRIAADNRRSYGNGPALSQTTVRIKAARGQSPAKLDATGAMRHDLTEAQRGTRKLTPGELEFGTTRPYARFARGTRHQPARSAMAVGQKTAEAAANDVLENTVKT
jgi:hypothetical protein